MSSLPSVSPPRAGLMLLAVRLIPKEVMEDARRRAEVGRGGMGHGVGCVCRSCGQGSLAHAGLRCCACMARVRMHHSSEEA